MSTASPTILRNNTETIVLHGLTISMYIYTCIKSGSKPVNKGTRQKQ